MPLFEAIANEKQLLLRIAAGDRDAFTRCYTHYYPLVQQHVGFFIPGKSELDELTQDVFLKIWTKRQLLTEVESFRGYLLRMSKNHVLNYFRSRKLGRKFVELASSEEGVAAAADDTESEFLFRQYYQIAHEAIGKLPGGRRKILKMSIEEGLTLDEIAARLEITRAGVKKQLYAATAFVRKYLQEHGELSLLLFVFLSLFES